MDEETLMSGKHLQRSDPPSANPAFLLERDEPWIWCQTCYCCQCHLNGATDNSTNHMPTYALFPKPLTLCRTESLGQVLHGPISNYQYLKWLQVLENGSITQVRLTFLIKWSIQPKEGGLEEAKQKSHSYSRSIKVSFLLKINWSRNNECLFAHKDQ